MMRTKLTRSGRAAVAAVLLACCAGPALAAQPSPQQVRQLMDVFGMNRMFQQMNAQMAGMMGQQLPCVPASYWSGFVDEQGMKDLTEKMIPVYQRHFTAEDIDGLLKFYSSPLGRTVVAEMPATMAEGMQIGRQWGEQRAQAMVAALQKKGTISAEGRCPATAAPAPLGKPAAGGQ